MPVDILGTNCDQCRSTVQLWCCFTSTETVRLVRTESPGRPPRLSHSSWTLRCLYTTGLYVYWPLLCPPGARIESRSATETWRWQKNPLPQHRGVEPASVPGSALPRFGPATPSAWQWRIEPHRPPPRYLVSGTDEHRPGTQCNHEDR